MNEFSTFLAKYHKLIVEKEVGNLEECFVENEDDPDEIRCLYCFSLSTLFEEAPIAHKFEFKDHVNGAVHKTVVHFLNSFGVYLTEKGLYCKLCEVTLVPDNDLVLYHLFSYAHRKDFSEPKYHKCTYCGASVDIDFYIFHSLGDCTPQNILQKAAKAMDREPKTIDIIVEDVGDDGGDTHDNDENSETDPIKIREERNNLFKSLLSNLYNK